MADAIGLGVNVLAPFLVFIVLRHRFGPTHALMLAALPPLAWALLELARKRLVDALSVLVLASIGLSLLAFIGGGGVRWLQIRQNMVNVAIGGAFLASAAASWPLTSQFGRARAFRQSQERGKAFEAKLGDASFRRVMVATSLIWGIGLIGEAAVACGLVFTVPIATYLLVNPILANGSIVGLFAGAAWYQRQQGE